MRRRYTKAQDEFIKKWYHKKSNIEIAKQLGKTSGGIQMRARLLNKTNIAKQYEYLLDDEGPMFSLEIAEKYNTSISSVLRTLRWWSLIKGARVRYAKLFGKFIFFIDTPDNRLQAWNKIQKKYKHKFDKRMNWRNVKVILGLRVQHNIEGSRKIFKLIKNKRNERCRFNGTKRN